MATGQKEDLVIPKWFITVAGAFMGLSIPWAGYVTMTLATISVKVETQAELRQRVDKLESRFTEHIVNPNIHSSGISRIESRIDGLERQIHKLEDK